MEKSEDSLIEWLAERFAAGDFGHGSAGGVSSSSSGREVVLGIGDDMAMVAGGSGEVLLTTDLLMDGVHFDSAVHSPEQIGRKALAASLSDCAAMAVRPCCAVVSVALPNAWSMAQAVGLYLGMEPLASDYGCSIVGGDTNSWRRPLVISVTVMAEPHEGIAPVRRDGARPGDELFVTGRLGGSGQGKHLSFQPRVAEAHWLAGHLKDALRAMLDLSDGLSTDAARVAAASGCGLVFEVAALEQVVSTQAHDAAQEDGRSPVDHALNDGEDFELFFAASPGSMVRLQDRFADPGGEDEQMVRLCTRIGVAIEEAGVWLAGADGSRQPVAPGGWQHFT